LKSVPFPLFASHQLPRLNVHARRFASVKTSENANGVRVVTLDAKVPFPHIGIRMKAGVRHETMQGA